MEMKHGKGNSSQNLITNLGQLVTNILLVNASGIVCVVLDGLFLVSFPCVVREVSGLGYMWDVVKLPDSKNITERISKAYHLFISVSLDLVKVHQNGSNTVILCLKLVNVDIG